MTQILYDSTEFFSVSRFAIFCDGSDLDRSIFMYFETPQFKNYHETNYTKIHSAVIEVLSFFVLF